MHFYDFSVWGGLFVIIVVLISLLVANMLKKGIPFLRDSLIPTSVLGGILILIISEIYNLFSDVALFNTKFFGASGYQFLEIITYHCLALGFIASSFKISEKKLDKKRVGEVFDSGVTTVSTYLLQGIFGLAITIIATLVMKDFFPAIGLVLPFGYGQGTGQAMNYGSIYGEFYNFDGGINFGLTIAALGFLSASIGGVIHLNILKKTGKFKANKKIELFTEMVEGENEIPMQGSIDKLTIQIALVAGAYLLAFVMMFLLGQALPGMKSTIYGFNFLLGVLSATLIKSGIKFFRKKNIMKKDYINNFLMTRTSNFFYDIMVVSGIAAIRLSLLQDYWGIVLILGVVGLVITYAYTRIVAKSLFKDYAEEQFLATYGMLTGTASTGIILLREIDGEFKTPASDNLVYQNFPAIVFGFPIMLLASFAPNNPLLTLILISVFFVVMNIILFRRQIFKRKKAKK